MHNLQPVLSEFERFHQLHHQNSPLILANVWNVQSAKIMQNNGYAAIGTSSGAIANSLGYDDGEKMPFDELLYIVKKIKANTHIPLSVDLERGYTDDLRTLTEHINRLTEIGVAGINLEDTQGEDFFLGKVEAIKNHLERNNQKLFLNARTDGFLQKLPAPLDLTIRRAKLYEQAGADGLFVTAVSDPVKIKAISDATSLPINVVATPKLASFGALSECGVKRISMAVFLYKATYNHLEKVAKQLKENGSLESLF